MYQRMAVMIEFVIVWKWEFRLPLFHFKPWNYYKFSSIHLLQCVDFISTDFVNVNME